MAEPLIRLALYESKDVVPIQSFAPGTYTFPLQVEGNSLLSTLYVKTAAAGASVTVNYWDFGPGSGETAGQRFNLQSHPAINTSDTTDRIIVTGLHNKPRIELVVTGGTITMGIYVTVVATFASDLDQSLKKHLQDADLVKDKGLVAVGYDATLGKFFFLPIENGAVKVTGTISSEVGGDPKALRSADGFTTTQNDTVNVIAEATVPTGKTWSLRKLQGHCRACGYFEVFVDGSKLQGVRLNSSQASENPVHPFVPYHKLTAGQKIIVKYTQSFGPTSDLGAVLYYTEA